MSADRAAPPDVRQAIADLQYDYCRFIDEMALDELAALFTEDAVTDYGPEERFRATGRDAIRRSLERMWRFARTSHHLSNVQVWLDGPDEARGISYVIGWHEQTDGTEALVYARYHNRFSLTEDGWRIARLDYRMTGNSASYTGALHRFERRSPPTGWTP